MMEKKGKHVSRGEETRRNEHEGNEDSIREISWKSLRVDLRKIVITVDGYKTWKQETSGD